eukprot:2813852-Pleurochrysis_carterae.AAC.2
MNKVSMLVVNDLERSKRRSVSDSNALTPRACGSLKERQSTRRRSRPDDESGRRPRQRGRTGGWRGCGHHLFRTAPHEAFDGAKLSQSAILASQSTFAPSQTETPTISKRV